jgi:arabinogalactan endo-1,4-beta-galactosidase
MKISDFKKTRKFFTFGFFSFIGILFLQAALPVFAQTGTFARGSDVSWVSQMVSQGIPFYNTAGVQENLFQVLQGNCINAIRLRVWVNPAAPGWNGQTDVVNKAVEAAAMGYRILIDFHYSDTWADPGDQNKPAAWANDTMAQLTQAVSIHTNSVLSALATAGVTPEWVQVGNETNDGMLWPVNTGDPGGRVSVNGFASFAQLINSGYAAVKAVFPNAKVIIHISNGYDNALFEWMFDGLKAAGANWDVIGMSLYPSTTDYTTLDAECLANMQDMITRYGKPVMNCEVGMAVNDPTDSEAFLTDIINKASSLPNGMGLGVFYWEPEAYNNWQGYGMGAFGNNGEPTAAMNAFGTGCAVPTPTYTHTAGITATNTPTNTATRTATPTVTVTPSKTATFSPTGTPTSTVTVTLTQTPTPTLSSTPSPTKTSTATSTMTKTTTPTSTVTPTSTPSFTATATTTPIRTATTTATVTQTLSSANTSTITLTPVLSFTPTSTATMTLTSTVTHTATVTRTSTATSTSTYTMTATATLSSTHTSTVTLTPAFTLTPTSTPSVTFTDTATVTRTFTAIPTLTYTPTETFTFTPSVTMTKTPTAIATMTSTPTPTRTTIATSTSTETPLGMVSTPVIYPNPATGSGPVSIRLPNYPGTATVTVKVFTTAFRMVNEFTRQSEGGTDIALPLTNRSGAPLANGLYYVVVTTPEGRAIEKLLVTR